MSSNKSIEARVEFTRALNVSSRDEPSWRLSIEDSSSGKLVLEAYLTDEAYALLHARRGVECDAQVFNGFEDYGKTTETMWVSVGPLSAPRHLNNEEFCAAIRGQTSRQHRELLDDGWLVQDPRSFSHHRWDPKTQMYQVTLYRHVERHRDGA